MTSGVWSLFGTPTMIRADVTGLLALPALYGAWLLRRSAGRAPTTGWRRTTAVAVGAALLPVGVLVTSATSCSESEGYQEVAVLEGAFPGPPAGTERRLAAGELLSGHSLKHLAAAVSAWLVVLAATQASTGTTGATGATPGLVSSNEGSASSVFRSRATRR